MLLLLKKHHSILTEELDLKPERMFWLLKIRGYRNWSYTSAIWGQVLHAKQKYQMFCLLMPNIYQTHLTCVLLGQVVLVGHMLTGHEAVCETHVLHLLRSSSAPCFLCNSCAANELNSRFAR